jgi:hypothetical protein
MPSTPARLTMSRSLAKVISASCADGSRLIDVQSRARRWVPFQQRPAYLRRVQKPSRPSELKCRESRAPASGSDITRPFAPAKASTCLAVGHGQKVDIGSKTCSGRMLILLSLRTGSAGMLQHLAEGIHGLQERLRVEPEHLHALTRLGADPGLLDGALIPHKCS